MAAGTASQPVTQTQLAKLRPPQANRPQRQHRKPARLLSNVSTQSPPIGQPHSDTLVPSSFGEVCCLLLVLDESFIEESGCKVVDKYYCCSEMSHRRGTGRDMSSSSESSGSVPNRGE